MRVTLDQVGHHFVNGGWLFRHFAGCFDAGSLTAVTGPSGSGKSTFLAIVARSLTPLEGEVVHETVKRVRWVFQNPLGVAQRSAIDHVMLPFFAEGWGRKQARDSAADILTLFHLEHVANRTFAQLSGGEAQRLMLARAMAGHPDLLLVDEPTSQLDHHAASTVASVLTSLAGSGAAVLVATHDPLAIDACPLRIDLVNYAD